MSIRDRGYQRYDGPRTPHAGRWAVVERHSLAMSARSAWVILILVFAGLWTIGWAVALYVKWRIWVALPAAAATAIGFGGDPSRLVEGVLVRWYGMPVFAFLMALFAGAGVVADDARQNAFQLYFARNVTPAQYLAGKLVPVLVLVGTVTIGPSLLLSLMRLALLRPGVDPALPLALLPLRAITLGAVEAAAFAAPALALSALGRRRALCQGAYATLVMLPWVVGAIVANVTRSAWPRVVAIPADVAAVGARLFAVEPEAGAAELPWLAALAVLALLVAGSIALLRRRLDSVEVVAG